MPDYAQEIMNMVKDFIPKTPEESRAASRNNPQGQWFEDFASGNMFERIHGYDGTESLYSGLVDKKGGSDLVSPQSYLGVVAKFVRAVFTYGDDSKKDEDPIYNTREGNPDIETGGTNTPKTTSLDGSVLYTRIENIFEYYSSKTQWMIEQTDGVKGLLAGLSASLTGFQEETQKKGDEQNQQNEQVSGDLGKISQDLADLSDKVNEIDKIQKADVANLTRLEKDAASIHTEISDIKKFVKMP